MVSLFDVIAEYGMTVSMGRVSVKLTRAAIGAIAMCKFSSFEHPLNVRHGRPPHLGGLHGVRLSAKERCEHRQAAGVVAEGKRTYSIQLPDPASVICANVMWVRLRNHHLNQAVELLTCDEARRIVVNIAKLPELHPGIVLNEHYEGDGEIVLQHACKLGCEGIVSKRLGSPYRSGHSPHWVKVKNAKAPAVTREAEEDCGR